MSANGPIYSDPDLLGHRALLGWRSGALSVVLHGRDACNALVLRHHYSHKVTSGTWLHFALFHDGMPGRVVGVLQYGYAMNPASGANIVPGTSNKQYVELNRMWVDDCMPRNTESQAISLTLRAIKGKHRDMRFVQSFADERCGGLGVVYQACSFGYYGEHTGIFWEMGGDWFHNITATAPRRRAVDNRRLLAGIAAGTARRVELRQFRYIHFFGGWEKQCTLSSLPYPKRSAAVVDHD